MQEVNVGIIGLGNVGMGTLGILAENAGQIALKLGFHLRVKALCSRSIHSKKLPAGLDSVLQTPDWQEVVQHPEVDIVAEPWREQKGWAGNAASPQGGTAGTKGRGR